MKKKLCIIFIVIFQIILFIQILYSFLTNSKVDKYINACKVTKINKNKISLTEQEVLADFYNKSTDSISYGEDFDVKVLWYDPQGEFKDSILQLAYKNDEKYCFDKIIVESRLCTQLDCENSKTVIENFKFKYKDNDRIYTDYRLQDFNSMDTVEYKKLINDYSSKIQTDMSLYDIKKLTFYYNGKKAVYELNANLDFISEKSNVIDMISEKLNDTKSNKEILKKLSWDLSIYFESLELNDDITTYANELERITNVIKEHKDKTKLADDLFVISNFYGNFLEFDNNSNLKEEKLKLDQVTYNSILELYCDKSMKLEDEEKHNILFDLIDVNENLKLLDQKKLEGYYKEDNQLSLYEIVKKCSK